MTSCITAESPTLMACELGCKERLIAALAREAKLKAAMPMKSVMTKDFII